MIKLHNQINNVGGNINMASQGTVSVYMHAAITRKLEINCCDFLFTSSSSSSRCVCPISIAVAWTSAGKVSTIGMGKPQAEPEKRINDFPSDCLQYIQCKICPHSQKNWDSIKPQRYISEIIYICLMSL